MNFRFAGLAAFVIALLVALVPLSGCVNKITDANFEKVANGMSLSQVEKVLGPGTDDTPAAGFGVSGAGVGSHTASPEKVYVWKSEGMVITVVFKDGKVVQKSKT